MQKNNPGGDFPNEFKEHSESPLIKGICLRKKVFEFFCKNQEKTVDTFSFLWYYKSRRKTAVVLQDKRIVNHEEQCGSIAQLGEHLPYKQGVTGSSPVVPTKRNGLVVQLVRTLACHARGRGFEPHPGRQIMPL